MPWKKNKTIDPKQATAQEFVNVEDILDGLLYSRDGYLFGFLALRGIDNKLLSEDERVRRAEQLSIALGSEREPWQLLSVPRTVDVLGMLQHLGELRRNTGDDARLKLIGGEIASLQEMAREGTKEPMIVLKLWQKAARGADGELMKRLREIGSRLQENQISAERMNDQEITYLCKVFADLTSYQEPEAVFEEEDPPILPGRPRRLFRERRDAEENAGLLSLITPLGGLLFGISKVVVGSVVGRVYGAVKYPSELDYGWMVELMNAGDTVTSVTYYPGSAAELGSALSQSARRGIQDAASTSDLRSRKKLERQVSDADRLIDELDARNAAIGHLAILAMPFADEEERLEAVCRSALNRFARKRIRLKLLGSLQKAAYRHLAPYYPNQPEMDQMLCRIMPLETLMGGDPATINVYRDDHGSYFARTADGNIMSLDPQYRGGDRTNGNFIFTGESGQGKSTALKHILLSLYMSGVKLVIIDPEREFRDMCANLGGTWLDAGGGTAKNNPLQIRAAPEDEAETAPGDRLYQSADNAMALHIHTLETFFKLRLPSLTDLQLSLLKQSLVELYHTHGISWDTDVRELAPADYPIMAELHDLLERKSGSDPRYEDLSALLYDMAKGADAFLWNGHSNVDTRGDCVVIDTNRLQNSSDEVKAAQYFNYLTLGWVEICADRRRPVVFVCDEAHILFDPANPRPAMMMRNIAVRARKYEGALMVAFQSLAFLMSPEVRLYGQALVDNSTYKILFGCDGKNLEDAAALFRLTESECAILRGRRRSRALCLIGQQHISVVFQIPQYKLELMGTGGGR